ncbi:hypothetical protein LBMAG53_32910 [Planctomycetota bacterium]|nr:hypothetical protein LBMAG53_32910 [Planctomycetota bacterium]
MRLSPGIATATASNLGELLAVLGDVERGFSDANLSVHADLRAFIQCCEQYVYQARVSDPLALAINVETFCTIL